MKLGSRIELELPAWLGRFVDAWPHPLDSMENRMRLAVALSAENVRQKTGGPFGAIVVDDRENLLLGAGVNLVTSRGLSMAHAEMIAVSLAQLAAGTWNLGRDSRVQLVTSSEPCAMCFGAIPWSGVNSVVWGARRKDIEAAGFDEGDKPADWIETLELRGIRTRGDVLRREAGAVLARYAHRDGHIYHPEKC